MTIRVFVVDDSAIVRQTLQHLLQGDPEIELQGAAPNPLIAAPMIRKLRPDVLLLDIEMPGMDGIAVVEQLHRQAPGVRCLIVTTFGRPGYLRRAIDAGAAGFVVKDSPAAELADAVRRVHAGFRVVDPQLATESLIEGMNPLSKREQEVLGQALTGAPVAQIARTLHLSMGTVRNYLSTAATKVGARSSVEAAVIARDRGWL